MIWSPAILLFILHSFGIIVLAYLIVFKFLNKSKSESTKKSTANRNRRARKQPFRNWTHPEKNFVDKCISFVLPFLLPVADMAKYPSHNKSENNGTRKVVASIREKMNKLEEQPFQASCKEWNVLVQDQNKGDTLVSGSVMIPRHHEVLSLFGFVPSSPGSAVDRILSKHKPEDNGPELTLDLTCPRSIIQSGIELEYELGSDEDAKHLEVHGFRQFRAAKLKDIVFHESAQLLLWFHGGGLAIGSAKDGNHGVGTAVRLSKILLQQNIASTRKGETSPKKAAPDGSSPSSSLLSPPIVLLSVSYRLAPENPFPAAVIDGLSASSFLIQNYPSFNLHIGGISAGGNLSAVVGLETFRKFGGITSIMMDCPMTQPHANSLSYYLNSKSSGMAPVEFLRWCWSAYLGLELDEKKNRSIDFSAEDAISEALDDSAWSSLYNGEGNADGSMLWRLVSPQFDLPSFDTDRAPKVIIATMTADPLHDDGVEIVKGLKKMCRKKLGLIYHFDLKGSHAASNIVDPKGKEACIKEWSMVFS